jgi:hypothetical protein
MDPRGRLADPASRTVPTVAPAPAEVLAPSAPREAKALSSLRAASEALVLTAALAPAEVLAPSAPREAKAPSRIRAVSEAPVPTAALAPAEVLAPNAVRTATERAVRAVASDRAGPLNHR